VIWKARVSCAYRRRGSNRMHLEDMDEPLLPPEIDIAEMERETCKSLEESRSKRWQAAQQAPLSVGPHIRTQVFTRGEDGDDRRHSFHGTSGLSRKANPVPIPRRVTFGAHTPGSSIEPHSDRVQAVGSQRGRYALSTYPKSLRSRRLAFSEEGTLPCGVMPGRLGGSSTGPDTLQGDENLAQQLQEE
jgi:hypothetical protein